MQKFVVASAFFASAALVSADTINCVVTNTAASQVTAGACTAAQATDITLANGVSWTPSINAVTITYTAVAGTTTTCSSVATDDSTTATCVSALALVADNNGELSADEKTCLSSTAQGDSKACALSDGSSCTAQQVCQNFTCNSKSVCAAEPAQDYMYTATTETDAAALKAAIDALLPATADAADPCSGLGVTTSAFIVYPGNENAFFTANPAIAADCLATDAFKSIAATTTANDSCMTTCGVTGCLCESGSECTINNDGSSNCLSGLTCKTDGTDGATTGVCNSGVMASAALAVAAAVLTIFF